MSALLSRAARYIQELAEAKADDTIIDSVVHGDD